MLRLYPRLAISNPMREKIASRDHHRSRDVPLPNLPRRGLVFRFSPLVPRLVRHVPPPTSLFTIRDLFPSPSAHLRSQKLVRPRRNGRSVAFWTRARSQEDREKKFASLSLSLSPYGSIFPHLVRAFSLSFLQSVQLFELGPASLSMQSPLLGSNVLPLCCFRNLSHRSRSDSRLLRTNPRVSRYLVRGIARCFIRGNVPTDSRSPELGSVEK